tara:strand:+ start:2666 stop:3289 length:624 start_codon:yes stop_codon:yes gene_type:complete
MQIGNLIASADQIFDRKSTPANLLIEDIGAAIPATKLLVEISGKPTISITSQNRLRAFAKLMMGGNGDTSLLNTIPIATGALKGHECNILITNGAATTPAVFASSPAASGRPYVAGEQTIQDSDRQTFRGFGYLIFDKTNLDYANVVFPDGWNEKMSGIELDQYFAIGRPYVEGDGTLSSQTIIDGSKFAEITLFTSGGSITVLRVD